MKPKSIFKSKSAIAATLVFISGALGTSSPDVSAFLSSNAVVINMIIGVAGFILRKVTHEKVVLWGSDDSNS